MFTLNIIKAVREKMGEAMNATVRITGGHLDLSDVSEKTILFVAIGAGEKSRNPATHFVYLIFIFPGLCVACLMGVGCTCCLAEVKDNNGCKV